MSGDDRRHERLVQVAVADNELIAELIKDELRQAGIRALVRNRELASMLVGGIGGTFEVFVLEGDRELASAVLGGSPPEELPPAKLPPPAEETRKRKRRWWG